jgi:hypothetical protein
MKIMKDKKVITSVSFDVNDLEDCGIVIGEYNNPRAKIDFDCMSELETALLESLSEHEELEFMICIESSDGEGYDATLIVGLDPVDGLEEAEPEDAFKKVEQFDLEFPEEESADLTRWMLCQILKYNAIL